MMGYGFMLMLVLRLPDWLTVKPDPVGLMIQMLLVGPLMGVTLGYVHASVMGWVGIWFDEPVDKRLVRPLIAWTNLPSMLALFVYAATYALFKFQLDPAERGAIWAFSRIEGMVALGLASVVCLYAVWVRVRGIGLLFGISGPKATAMWFLSFIMTFLPFAAIVTMFFLVFYGAVIGHPA
jgi:hypothetical protein